MLLVNHGAAPDTAAIPAFLTNIFADRDIIRLPVGGARQARLASLLARGRTPKVEALYRFMGGGSPLLTYMQAQARRLGALLPGMPVLIGLRYHEPSFGTALEEALRLGLGRLVVLPQYPQYSATTVGSCEAELARALDRCPATGRPETVVIPPFGAQGGHVAFIADAVRRAAARIPPPHSLVFTAHSVPMRFVEDGDPYRDEVEAQAGLVARAAGFDSYEIGYQSRSGPVRWLGPETRDVVVRLMGEGQRNIVLAPLSFVQDHLETLVELDVLIGSEILAAGGAVARARPAYCGQEFAEISAGLVRGALDMEANRTPTRVRPM